MADDDVRVALLGDVTVGTTQDANFQAALGGNRLALLERHGVVVAGVGRELACFALRDLEAACWAQYEARAAGKGSSKRGGGAAARAGAADLGGPAGPAAGSGGNVVAAGVGAELRCYAVEAGHALRLLNTFDCGGPVTPCVAAADGDEVETLVAGLALSRCASRAAPPRDPQTPPTPRAPAAAPCSTNGLLSLYALAEDDPSRAAPRTPRPLDALRPRPRRQTALAGFAAKAPGSPPASGAGAAPGFSFGAPAAAARAPRRPSASPRPRRRRRRRLRLRHAKAPLGYPPMATKAPSKLPFGAPAPAAKAPSGYPPMATKAPSKLPFARHARAAKAPSGYPPMATKAPSKLPFGAPAPAPAAKAPSGYPPMATKAPSKLPFGAPAPAPAAKAPSGYPPMATKAPSKLPFGAPAPAAKAPSGYPPMATKAPSKLPFGAPAPAAKAPSGYPPMATKAPSKLPFGAPAPAPAAKAPSGYPPMATKAPSKLPFGAPAPAPAAKAPALGDATRALGAAPAAATLPSFKEIEASVGAPAGGARSGERKAYTVPHDMVVPKDAAEAEKWRVVLDFEQSMADMREAMRASKVEVDAAVDEGRRKGEDERRELREAQALVREYRAQERELGEMRAQLLGSCEDVRRQCADAKSSLEIAEGTLADCDDPEKKAKADEWARVLETQPLDVASKARLERLEKLACDVASTLSDVKLVNEHREKLEASLPKATVSSFFTSPRRTSRGPGVLGDATNDGPRASAAPLLIRRIKATYEASLKVTEVTLPDLDRRLKLALEEKRELERRIERSREDASPESAAAGSYFSPGGDEPKALADAPFASSHDHDEEAQLQRNLAALFAQPFKTVVRDFRPHSLRGAEHCVWSAKRLDKARREADEAAPLRRGDAAGGAPAAAPKPPTKGRPLEPDASSPPRKADAPAFGASAPGAARRAPGSAPRRRRSALSFGAAAPSPAKTPAPEKPVAKKKTPTFGGASPRAAPAPAPAFGAAPPAPPPAATDYKARIVALYAKHAPDKVGNVDALLAIRGPRGGARGEDRGQVQQGTRAGGLRGGGFGAAPGPRAPFGSPAAAGGAAALAPATPFGTAPAPAQPTSMFTPSKGAASGGLFAPGGAGALRAAPLRAPSAGARAAGAVRLRWRQRRRAAGGFGGFASGGATFGAAAAPAFGRRRSRAASARAWRLAFAGRRAFAAPLLGGQAPAFGAAATPAFGGGAAAGATFGAAAAQSSFGQPAAAASGAARPSARAPAFGAAPSGFRASAPALLHAVPG
ncbi:hypothetical protein JL721_288 [Aureococcus anophagefferens]|nr:hypothetical protein JL721_288 [Aureococcus anophagefferens]